MNLYDSFDFGKYIGLTPKEVFSGTDKIDENLSSDFVQYCLNDLKGILPVEEFEFIDEFIVEKDIIYVIPSIDNEDKLRSYGNRLIFDDISNQIKNHITHCIRNMYDGSTQLEIFNYSYYNKVIGGNPEYIEWVCMAKRIFSIEQLNELKKYQVNRLKGIRIEKIDDIKYQFSWFFTKEYFKFKEETLENTKKWEVDFSNENNSINLKKDYYYILANISEVGGDGGHYSTTLSFEKLRSREIASEVSLSLDPPTLIRKDSKFILTNDNSFYNVLGCYNLGFFYEFLNEPENYGNKTEIFNHLTCLSEGQIQSFYTIFEPEQYDYGNVYFYKGISVNTNFDHFSSIDYDKIKRYSLHKFENQNRISNLKADDENSEFIEWRDLKFVRICEEYVAHYSKDLRVKVKSELELKILQRFYNFKFINFKTEIKNYKNTFKFYLELCLDIDILQFEKEPYLLKSIFSNYEYRIEEGNNGLLFIYNDPNKKYLFEKNSIDRFYKHNIYFIDENKGFKEIKQYQEKDFKLS